MLGNIIERATHKKRHQAFNWLQEKRPISKDFSSSTTSPNQYVTLATNVGHCASNLNDFELSRL